MIGNWIQMGYSESDTRSKIIDPKIKQSGWQENSIIREYHFTDGRKLIGNKRGKRYFVDYLLTFKNTNLAIIEAKQKIKTHWMAYNNLSIMPKNSK